MYLSQHTVTCLNTFLFINVEPNKLKITNNGFYKFFFNYEKVYHILEGKGEFFKNTSWGPKTQNLGEKPLKTVVNIIGFVWPMKLSKGLQKGLFVPILKKVSKMLWPVEHTLNRVIQRSAYLVSALIEINNQLI